MTTWIALLRGINVGGNNKVKMAELRQMLGEVGFEGVQTLLQSGNVVLQAKSGERNEVETLLERETAARLGVRCDYMARTAGEWDRMIAENPFVDQAESDPSHLLAMVMKATPDPALLQAIRDGYQGPERLEAIRDTIYISFPEGIGTSKLSAYTPYGKLARQGTGRNWNTVLKLQSLAKGGHPST